jgi:hypothetical protein
MKNDKLIPGLILVMIGAAILLANYGYLQFHWWNIFRLWPIFLVIGGVNLILAHNKSPWSTILRIAVVVLGVGLLLFGNFGERYSFWPGHHFSFQNNNNDDRDNNDDDNSDDDDNYKHQTPVKLDGNNTFNEPYTTAVKTAKLMLSGDVAAFKIQDTTNQLFSAIAPNKENQFNFSNKREDSVYVLDFHMRDRRNMHFSSDHNNTTYIKLNTAPIWLVDVNTDMAGVDLDLSKYKVKQISFHGDMAGAKFKLGMPLAVTEVEVESDMAGVDILVPQGAAYSIESDSDLSGNNFDQSDIHKIDDDHYETNGYATAKTKFHIHISGDFSGFNVKRY